jgi:hypothetical protein
MPLESTAEDVRLYLEVGLSPVVCASCGVEALVKKNSRRHTSVQWTAQAVAGCPEIAAARAADPDALVLGCARLKASIDAAAAAGQLVVPDA